MTARTHPKFLMPLPILSSSRSGRENTVRSPCGSSHPCGPRHEDRPLDLQASPTNTRASCSTTKLTAHSCIADAMGDCTPITRAYTRVFVHTLEYARVCSSMLEYARVCSSALQYARVRTSMLEYARVCSSMFEHAGACSNILEYAGVELQSLQCIAALKKHRP